MAAKGNGKSADVNQTPEEFSKEKIRIAKG
jgi:hypothetical protein